MVLEDLHHPDTFPGILLLPHLHFLLLHLLLLPLLLHRQVVHVAYFKFFSLDH